jgi:hypothetical protein
MTRLGWTGRWEVWIRVWIMSCWVKSYIGVIDTSIISERRHFDIWPPPKFMRKAEAYTSFLLRVLGNNNVSGISIIPGITNARASPFLA